MKDDYPQVIVGSVETPLPDWRLMPEEEDPDDEELPESPPEIVAMLGFNPADIDE